MKKPSWLFLILCIALSGCAGSNTKTDILRKDIENVLKQQNKINGQIFTNEKVLKAEIDEAIACLATGDYKVIGGLEVTQVLRDQQARFNCTEGVNAKVKAREQPAQPKADKK